MATSAAVTVAASVRPCPLAAHGRVGSVDDCDVIPPAAVDLVGPAVPRHEPVGTGATAEAILARAAPDGVVAGASVQHIVAAAAPDGVAARTSADLVAICAAPDGVAAAAAAKAVAAGLALDQVTTGARVDPVPAPRALQSLAGGASVLAEPAAAECRRGGGPRQHGLAPDRDRDQDGRRYDGCQDQELAEHRHDPTRAWDALATAPWRPAPDPCLP
jgi:hypothetical protein